MLPLVMRWMAAGSSRGCRIFSPVSKTTVIASAKKNSSPGPAHGTTAVSLRRSSTISSVAARSASIDSNA